MPLPRMAKLTKGPSSGRYGPLAPFLGLGVPEVGRRGAENLFLSDPVSEAFEKSLKRTHKLANNCTLLLALSPSTSRFTRASTVHVGFRGVVFTKTEEGADGGLK